MGEGRRDKEQERESSGDRPDEQQQTTAPTRGTTYNHGRYGGCGGTGPRPVRVAPWQVLRQESEAVPESSSGPTCVDTSESVGVTRLGSKLFRLRQVLNVNQLQLREHERHFRVEHVCTVGRLCSQLAGLQAGKTCACNVSSRVGRAGRACSVHRQLPTQNTRGVLAPAAPVCVQRQIHLAPHYPAPASHHAACATPAPTLAAHTSAASPPPCLFQLCSWAPTAFHHERQPERADPRDD